MQKSTILKWVTGGLEAFWGVPFIGGTIILAYAWTPLVIMLVLHIITLILSLLDGRRIIGSVLGIITSSIGWIPFVGMFMHIITAIVLVIDAYSASRRY